MMPVKKVHEKQIYIRIIRTAGNRKWKMEMENRLGNASTRVVRNLRRRDVHMCLKLKCLPFI